MSSICSIVRNVLVAFAVLPGHLKMTRMRCFPLHKMILYVLAHLIVKIRLAVFVLHDKAPKGFDDFGILLALICARSLALLLCVRVAALPTLLLARP